MVDASEYAGPVRIVLLMVIAFVIAIVNQVRAKVKIIKEYRARKEIFVRWANADSRMVTADRVVGNLVEWGFVFWPLFIANVFLFGPEGTHILAGYVYAVARFLYVVAGCSRTFPNHGNLLGSVIVLFTAPAYLALGALAWSLGSLAL